MGYGGRFSAYSLEMGTNGTWNLYLQLSSGGDADGHEFGAVTDVENGLIYAPFQNYMMRINTAGPSYDKVAMPPHMNKSFHVSVAWSAYSQKLYFLGGMDDTGVLQGWKAFSYSSTEGWINLSTSMKGTIPAFRKWACFVPAYNGFFWWF